MMRLVLVVDTLLGPEGMTVGCFLGRVLCGAVWCGGVAVAWRGWLRIPDAAVVPSWWGVGWCCWCGVVVAGGLFVENYTVDASIFVVKLSRADGGCLGTRSR